MNATAARTDAQPDRAMLPELCVDNCPPPSDSSPQAVVTLAGLEPNKGRTARKAYVVNADGTLGRRDYSLGRHFLLQRHVVHGHAGLLDLARRLEGDGGTVLLRGHASQPEAVLLQPRLWRARPDHPATLDDLPSILFTGDIDGLPNTEGRDPRDDPERTAAWMLARLGPEFERCAAIVVFSASCCLDMPDGTPPPTLNARILLLMDEALDHAAIKSLMQGMEARLVAGLPEAQRPPRGTRIIDWSVTMPMQPVYLAAPLFLHGRTDPFQGRSRIVSLDGAYRAPTLCVRDLRAAIGHLSQPDRRARRTALEAPKAIGSESRAVSAECAPQQPRAVRPALPLPPVPRPPLHPDLAAICRRADLERIAATANAAGKGRPRGAEARAVNVGNLRTGYARAAVEALRLLHARTVWGAQFGEYAAWAEAGTAPRGQRDLWAFVISALVGAAATDEDTRDGRLDRIVAWIARIAGGDAWAAEEWSAGGMDGALMGRCRAAAAGLKVTWNGREVDPRYCYALDTVVGLLDVGEDEALALGLISLAPADWIASLNRRRHRAARQGGEHRTELEMMLDRAEMRRMVMRIPAARRTAASAMAALSRAGWEVSESTVRRLLGEGRINVPKFDFVLAGIGFRGGVACQTVRNLALLSERGERGTAGRRDRREVDQILAALGEPQESQASHPAQGTGEARRSGEARSAWAGIPLPAAGVGDAAGPSPQGMGEAETGIHIPAAGVGGTASQPAQAVGDGGMGIPPLPVVSAGPPAHGGRRLVGLTRMERMILRGDSKGISAALVDGLNAFAEGAGQGGRKSPRLSLPAGCLLNLDHPAAAEVVAAWEAVAPGTSPAPAERLGARAGLVAFPRMPTFIPSQCFHRRPGEQHLPREDMHSVMRTWAAVDAAWTTAWRAMAGEDDAVIRAALVAAVQATAKAVRARGATRETENPAHVLRLPFDAALDRGHPMATEVMQAMSAVDEARKAVWRRDRKRRAAMDRETFGMLLPGTTARQALGHVARRSLAVRERFEARIRALLGTGTRAAKRMHEVPEAKQLHRAMSAVLRADRAEVAAADISPEVRDKCIAMLWPDLSWDARGEMQRRAADRWSAIMPEVVNPIYVRALRDLEAEAKVAKFPMPAFLMPGKAAAIAAAEMAGIAAR